MKRTQIKDALRNIRKLQISFWSIVVIAALGVTIFPGVDYAAAALREVGSPLSSASKRKNSISGPTLKV